MKKINVPRPGKIVAADRSLVRLELSEILTDDIQVRVKLDQYIVDEYAELYQEGVQLPPPVVYNNGSNIHVGDRRHRLAAAEQCGFIDIEADVRKGTRLDAMWFALGANKAHGLRMNRADTRKAVGLALQLFPDRGLCAIARQIGCGDQLVSDVRAELESNCVIHAVEKTVGADGKLGPAQRKTKPKPVSKLAEASDDCADTLTATPMADVPPDANEHAPGALTEQPAEQEAKPVGFAMAQRALDILMAIPSDDAERMQAISLISVWFIEVTSALGSGGQDQSGNVVGLAHAGGE